MSADRAVLSPDDVLTDLHVTTRRGLFDDVADHIAARYGLAHDKVSDSLMAREQLGSTGLAFGVAIPHARLPEAPGVIAVFARPSLPLDFDAPDGKPVSDFLVLIVPTDSPQQHLDLLSALAARFNDRGFRDTLRSATDAQAIAHCFAELRISDRLLPNHA